MKPRVALLCAALAAGCVDDRPEGPRAPNLVERREAEVDLRLAALGPRDAVLLAPSRVAAGPGDRLLVSDPRHRMVVLLHPRTLEPAQGFRVDGVPMAVGMGHGRVYVGNLTKRRVEVYNAHGGFRFAFGTLDPMDLAVDERNGAVFVVDGALPGVRVFTSEGRFVRTIGGPASDLPLGAPTGIALDPSQREVFVATYDRPGVPASVEIYDYDGNHLGGISGEGTCTGGGMGMPRTCSGGFSRPQGLAVDAGRVYVTDVVRGTVLVFDRETRTAVGTLGSHVAEGGTLRFPLDVIVGRQGAVFVTSRLTASVERFDAAGVAP